jgi:DNA-directed RNA polymerase sigma subunit (sigma70/sigma32)
MNWTPDPTRGGPEIEARKAQVVEHLKKAVDVAYYHIDQQLDRDIADLKKKAGEQKSKMVAFVKKAEDMPAMSVVRKYWQKDQDDVLHHLTETIMRDGG